MAKKTYQIKFNPKTREILRNSEVYCFKCFENFGNLETLYLHQFLTDDGEEICLPPKFVPLTPQKNFAGVIVWRETF